ncbi:DUF4328 domain-containing protein [Lewinella sp. IMCC34191]|uniref:DUF4328 domain-containing protein n=1 Tax=Lewinella sp. IMCC34191 TaxID=2259172 RepID=UPI000E2493FF|nr:DUF4328 domain-containing protein [Lewinella sp. IMCC34191]
MYADRYTAQKDQCDLRPNDRRAYHAITLLYLALALQLLIIVSAAAELFLLNEFEQGTDVDPTLIDMADTSYAVAGMGYLCVLVASAFTFIRWFRRAYFNLHLLPVRVDHGEGWAAGSWFVPILNVFRPYQIMRELFVKSEYLLRDNDRLEKSWFNYSLLGTWWGVWAVFGVLDRIGSRLDNHLDLDSIGGLQTSFQMDVVLYIVGTVAAYLAIQVVRNYSRVEQLLRERYVTDEALILDSFVPDGGL